MQMHDVFHIMGNLLSVSIRLKMCCRTLHSCTAHALCTSMPMPSGPVAFPERSLLSPLLTGRGQFQCRSGGWLQSESRSAEVRGLVGGGPCVKSVVKQVQLISSASAAFPHLAIRLIIASDAPHASAHLPGVIQLQSGLYLSPVRVLALLDLNPKISLN